MSGICKECGKFGGCGCKCPECGSVLCWCGIPEEFPTLAEFIGMLNKLPDKNMRIGFEIAQDNSIYLAEIRGIKKFSEIADLMPVNEAGIRKSIKKTGDKYVIISKW